MRDGGPFGYSRPSPLLSLRNGDRSHRLFASWLRVLPSVDEVTKTATAEAPDEAGRWRVIAEPLGDTGGLRRAISCAQFQSKE